MNSRMLSAVVVLLSAFAVVRGEEIPLFRASASRQGEWGESEARVAPSSTQIVIAEDSKAIRRCGNVFTKTLLPYFPCGVVDMDVQRVHGCSYSLQVLCFRRGAHLGTVDLVSDSNSRMRRRLELKDFNLPGGADSVLLKVWVSGGAGARIVLKDLLYSFTPAEQDVLLDARFDQAATWEKGDLSVSQTAGEIEVHMARGAEFGSLLCPDTLGLETNAIVLLEVKELEDVAVSLQAIAFNGSMEFLSSIDTMVNVSRGWNTARLKDFVWPDQTASIQFKLWAKGAPTARAVLGRLLLVRDPIND